MARCLTVWTNIYWNFSLTCCLSHWFYEITPVTCYTTFYILAVFFQFMRRVSILSAATVGAAAQAYWFAREVSLTLPITCLCRLQIKDFHDVSLRKATVMLYVSHLTRFRYTQAIRRNATSAYNESHPYRIVNFFNFMHRFSVSYVGFIFWKMHLVTGLNGSA
jgi:hypothetical protein